MIIIDWSQGAYVQLPAYQRVCIWSWSGNVSKIPIPEIILVNTEDLDFGYINTEDLDFGYMNDEELLDCG